MSSSLSLFLKVKGSTESLLESSSPQFSQVNENTIQFGSKQYRFKKIIDGANESFPAASFPEGPDADGCASSECFIFLGPTGSGKTTTMSQVLQDTLSGFDDDAGVSMTAFEVIDNKIITDLLDENLKKEYNITFESQLRRIEAPKVHHLQSVFAHRSSFKTPANPLSSRSCLVVTFHQDSSRRLTFIDMMGNEKYDKHTSNVFANLNMSSITELLVKKSNGFGGRSSNLVTNLIFKKDEQNHIKLILHLDPNGNASLTKSSLNNIALLVHKFKMEMKRSPQLKSKSIVPGSLVPSYARPTIASSTTPSSKVTKSIHKVKSSRKLNHTASTAVATARVKAMNILTTPAKNILLEKPANLILPPTTSKIIQLEKPVRLQSSPIAVSTMNSSPAPRALSKEKPPMLRIASSPIRSRAPELKFKSMREKLKDKIVENETLRRENVSMVELLDKTRQQISEYSELAEMERRREEVERARLHEAKREIMEQVDAFKSEFYVFKDTHESFNGTVESLKVTLASIEKENRVLQTETENLKTEFSSKEASLVISNRELKSEIEQLNSYLLNERSTLFNVEKKNSELNLNLEELNARNSELSQQYSRAIGDLEEQVIMNKEIKEKLECKLAEQAGAKDSQILSLNEQISTQNSEHNNAIAEKDSQLEERDNLLAQLKESLMFEQNKVVESRDSIGQLKMELENTRVQLSTLESKVQATSSELGEKSLEARVSQEKLSETEELLNFANSEMERLQSDINELKESSFDMRKSLEKARDQSLSKDDELAATKEKLLEYEDELSVNRKELQRLRETHGEANNELLTAMAELDMAEKALESKQYELKSLESEKLILAADLETLQSKNSSMKMELDELKANQASFELQEQNLKLKAELDQLMAEHKNTKKELIELKNASESLTFADSDSEEVSQTKENHQQVEIEKLKAEVAEIEHLRDVLGSRETQIAQLKADIDEGKGDLQSKVDSLYKERCTLVQEKEDLLNSLTSMKTKYYSVSQELKTMKKDAMLLKLGNNELMKMSASPESSILATSSPNSPIEEIAHDDIITTPILLEAPLKKPFDAKQIFRDKTSKSPSKSPSKSKKDKHALAPSNRNLMELGLKKDKKLKRKHSEFKLNSNKLQRAV